MKFANGNPGGSHWLCYYTENKQSFYFESIAGSPDKILLQQLSKPIVFHDLEDKKIRLCEVCFLNFFYLKERMNSHDAVLTINFR